MWLFESTVVLFSMGKCWVVEYFCLGSVYISIIYSDIIIHHHTKIGKIRILYIPITKRYIYLPEFHQYSFIFIDG